MTEDVSVSKHQPDFLSHSILCDMMILDSLEALALNFMKIFKIYEKLHTKQQKQQHEINKDAKIHETL